MSFTPTGRHQLKFELDLDHVVVTIQCDVCFDEELIYDWSAEDWHGDEALVGWTDDDIYDAAGTHLERKWKREQQLITLITGE